MEWGLVLASLIPTIANLLFGGSKSSEEQRKQVTETVTEQPPPRPFDPGYGLLSPFLLNTMLQRFGQLSGAGMPTGTPALGADWIKDILELLSRSWPDILKGYTQPGKEQSKEEIQRLRREAFADRGTRREAQVR